MSREFIINLKEGISKENRDKLWDLCINTYPHATIYGEDYENYSWTLLPGKNKSQFLKEIETLDCLITNSHLNHLIESAFFTTPLGDLEKGNGFIFRDDIFCVCEEEGVDLQEDDVSVLQLSGDDAYKVLVLLKSDLVTPIKLGVTHKKYVSRETFVVPQYPTR